MMKRLFKGGTVVSGEGLKRSIFLVKGKRFLRQGKILNFRMRKRSM